MIRVVFRVKVAEPSREGFVRAWREATAAIRGSAPGAKGGLLLQSLTDPRELVIVARWESYEAWREFWSKGPPEPQGDPSRNEVLIEMAELAEEEEGESS